MVVRRQLEPFLWIVFSAGGVLAALVLPVLVVLFGLAFPLQWLAPPRHADLLAALASPLTRVIIVVLITLSLFHAAHRFRYTLYDGLQIKHLNELVRLFCYGGALLGTAAAVYVLWTIP
jgi:fumarate reductase subunit D